jgi:hypothetical protein
MDDANRVGPKLDNKNRRSAVRKRPRGLIKIDCRKCGSCGPSIAEVMWDLSQTGICLVSNVPLAVNDEVEIQINSTSVNQNIKSLGKVIWIDALDNKKFSMGVRFHDPLPYALVGQLTH